MNPLLCYNGGDCESQVVFTGIQISQIIRIVAAGDLEADAVTREKSIAGWPPEFDDVGINLIGFNGTQAISVEGSCIFRISMPRPHHSFCQKRGSAIGTDVAQSHHSVGVFGARGREDFCRDRTDDFNVLFKHGSCVNQDVFAGGRFLNVARSINMPVLKIGGGRWIFRIVDVTIFRLIAGRNCGKSAIASGRICFPLTVQVVLRPLSFRERPLGRGAPLIQSHHEQVNRRIIEYPVFDSFEMVIEPAADIAVPVDDRLRSEIDVGGNSLSIDDMFLWPDDHAWLPGLRRGSELLYTEIV